MKQTTFKNQMVRVTFTGLAGKTGTAMAIGLGPDSNAKASGMVRLKVDEAERKRLNLDRPEFELEPRHVKPVYANEAGQTAIIITGEHSGERVELVDRRGLKWKVVGKKLYRKMDIQTPPIQSEEPSENLVRTVF